MALHSDQQPQAIHFVRVGAFEELALPQLLGYRERNEGLRDPDPRKG